MKLLGAFVLLTLFAVFSFPSTGCHATGKRKKLLYILIDGFRYDYTDDQPAPALPGFSKFLREGVRAEYMTPIYPSISYPDWTTLVTGLWAESHGIVGNYFYDPVEKDLFKMPDADSTGKRKWWTAEPIWTTASKANLRTAVILWSRCDIPFDGITPEYCEPFTSKEGSEIFKTNIHRALVKLNEGFDFVQVYNEHTDNIGHHFGPESDERKKAVRDLDYSIGYLLQGLEAMGMREEVNIIIVSDHGMTTARPDKVRRVELDDYLLTEYVENAVESQSFTVIKVTEERHIDKVYEKLKKMPGVEVYRHHEIPDEFHFKNNKYIHDILIKANLGTFIEKSSSPVHFPPRQNCHVYRGSHGYDPKEMDMKAIFFASGPDFRVGSTIKPIKNVDVYPLLAHLLQVNPRPNNGTFENIKPALRQSSEKLPAPVDSSGSSTAIFTSPEFLFLPLLLILRI